MVEVVGQYTELRKAGANYTGRCPFHEEKTPSFSVNPTEKLFYCFGCGVGGNLFGFVQQKENLEFAAAVEYLADKYGVVLEYEESSARGDAERHRRERLRALLEQATAYYERVLAEAKAAAPARDYLTRRGLADEVCREFRLGFSRPGWDKLRDAARAKGFTEQELLDAGLVIPGKSGRPYDRFRGRIMFPLATIAAAPWASAPAPWVKRSPSTSTRRRRRSTTRVRRCSVSTRPGRRPAKRTASTSSRATLTSWRSPRPAWATSWPAWARPSLSSSSNACHGSRTACICASTRTPPASAPCSAPSPWRGMDLTMHVVRIPDGLDPADYVLCRSGRGRFPRACQPSSN